MARSRHKHNTKKRRPSTALVRRKPPALRAYHWKPGRTVQDQRIMVPVEPVSALTLPSDPMMTAAFIGTLKLTETQILALRRPVLDAEVEWKPAVKDGPAIIPYLSHNGYRDRLDAAFGLGGWGMVPVGMPKQVGDDFIYVPYALVIDGVPRAYAWGEQQIHKMTYGDALEGAKSNAIVRCGKELGIARELWNRANIAGLKARKDSVVANGRTRASDRQTNGYHAHEDEPITKPQRRRLWTIIKHSGRTEAEIALWLKAVYGLDHTDRIKRVDYDAICTAVERPGPLPGEA
jgi:hypothetical protein